MTLIKNIIIGAVIGVANIIPGVSGGTMMVILNVINEPKVRFYSDACNG